MTSVGLGVAMHLDDNISRVDIGHGSTQRPDDVDGALVGGASLVADDFIGICTYQNA